MKALSVLQPYTSFILWGDKTVEWRSWRRKYRGDLLICSSKLWADIPEVDDIPDESLGLFPLGSALCVVELYDIVPFEEKHFKAALFDELPNPAGYAWLLRNVRPVKAFNVRGMPGLFEVEDNLIKYL